MRRSRLARFSVAAIVLLVGWGGSCSGRREDTTPRAPALAPPDLRILVLTDLSGYLEPCGCTSRPLGGIDRLAARVGALRQEGVPSLLVAAGNLMFHGSPEGSAERARDQEVLRAETLREILGRIELSAASPGPLDFSFGNDTLARIAREASFPLLAAGVSIEGSSPPFVPSVTREVGAMRVGIVGLSDLRDGSGALPEGAIAEDLLASGRAAVGALDADIVVALVNGDRRAARHIATGIGGIDFVIHGGLDEADVHEPTIVGGVVIVHAGRQGQGFVVLDVRRRGDGAWTDASEWTREGQRTHLRGRIDSLRARIEEWSAQDTAAADLADQRQRLARLEAEFEALDRPVETEGSFFTARYEELPPSAPRDDAITRLMSDLDRRVNQHNRDLFADWAPEPAPEGAARYVGSQACESCHADAMAWWRRHPHGSAYATLEERHKNFNLSCVGCHVTGYLRPGGSTVTHVENLEDVGCESCHGPGSVHVQTEVVSDIVRSPDARECRVCHNPDHSDRFHFETYRQLLIAPGHGAPLAHVAATGG